MLLTHIVDAAYSIHPLFDFQYHPLPSLGVEKTMQNLPVLLPSWRFRVVLPSVQRHGDIRVRSFTSKAAARPAEAAAPGW
jgi:hypothetical protein